MHCKSPLIGNSQGVMVGLLQESVAEGSGIKEFCRVKCCRGVMGFTGFTCYSCFVPYPEFRLSPSPVSPNANTNVALPGFQLWLGNSVQCHAVQGLCVLCV